MDAELRDAERAAAGGDPIALDRAWEARRRARFQRLSEKALATMQPHGVICSAATVRKFSLLNVTKIEWKDTFSLHYTPNIMDDDTPGRMDLRDLTAEQVDKLAMAFEVGHDPRDETVLAWAMGGAA